MVNREILDSWKEIAKYLSRDTRTCNRWEKELGLPIHRIDENSPRSKVFAYKTEIDEWLSKKSNNDLPPLPFYKRTHFIISTISFFLITSVIFAFLYFSNINSSSPSISLAVFPFRNLNTSEELEYLSQGVSSRLINSLSTQSKLRVISAEYPSNFENTPNYLKEVGEKLKANYLLNGDFEKQNEICKLALHLISTESGLPIWEDEFIDSFENLIDLNLDICLKIFENLRINSGEKFLSPIEGRNSIDNNAFDNYLKGNFILDKLNENENDPWKIFYKGQYYSNQNIRESNEIAVELFSRAIELDPEFALAYVGLANCYANFINFGWFYDLQWLQKSEDLLNKANTLSSNLPEYYSTLSKVYLTMASVFNLDTLEKASEVAEEGIKQYPNNSDINSKLSYFYYLKYGETGNETYFKKAINFMENSFLVRPLYVGNIFYADLLMLDKKFNEALKVVEQIRQNSSDYTVDYHTASIYYSMGELDKSRNVCKNQETNMMGIITNLYILGKIAAQEGHAEEADGYASRIKILSPDLQQYSISQFEISSIYFGINKKSLGYTHLIKFFNFPEVEKIKFIYLKFIEIDKNFDEVRNEAKFKEIINGGFNGKK